MTNLKTLDDYTKLPDGYGEIKICEEMQKFTDGIIENIKNMKEAEPYFVALASKWEHKDFLNESRMMKADVEKNYRPMKRRLTHGYRSSKKKPRLH